VIDEPGASPGRLRHGHRCYEAAVRGTLRYDPPRSRLARPWTACVELPEDFAALARDRFFSRHNIRLDPPEFGFHATVFSGSADATPEVRRLWGHLDGESFQVQLTEELFWKGRCVWANAYFPEYFLLRDTLGGLDSSDSELWGHATIGTFPDGFELPRFLDYRDLEDWGFRP
jgi:hypothetical protein